MAQPKPPSPAAFARLIALGVSMVIGGIVVLAIHPSIRNMSRASVWVLGIWLVVIGIGFVGIAWVQLTLVSTYRVSRAQIRIGDRVKDLDPTSLEFEYTKGDAEDELPMQKVARGQPFSIDLDVELLKPLTITSWSCHLVVEKWLGSHRDADRYQQVFQQVVDADIHHRPMRSGEHLRGTFALYGPEAQPPTSETHRWRVTVTTKAEGTPDFSVSYQLYVV